MKIEKVINLSVLFQMIDISNRHPLDYYYDNKDYHRPGWDKIRIFPIQNYKL